MNDSPVTRGAEMGTEDPMKANIATAVALVLGLCSPAFAQNVQPTPVAAPTGFADPQNCAAKGKITCERKCIEVRYPGNPTKQFDCLAGTTTGCASFNSSGFDGKHACVPK